MLYFLTFVFQLWIESNYLEHKWCDLGRNINNWRENEWYLRERVRTENKKKEELLYLLTPKSD